MQMIAHAPWEWSLFRDGDAYYVLVICGSQPLIDVVVALTAEEIAAWQQTHTTSMAALVHLIHSSPLPHVRHRADVASQLRPLRATTMDMDPLMRAIDASSKRMNGAALVTSLLCAGLAWLMTSDSSIWQAGVAWQIGAGLFTFLTAGMAIVMLYYALRGQRNQFAQLKATLQQHPQHIRTVALQVATGKPVAWVADDGRATRGLHVIVTSTTDQTWVLPVTRDTAPRLIYLLKQRCQLPT